MGRKSRRNNFEEEEDEEYEDEEYEEPKQLWSVIVQDTNDILMDMKLEFDKKDIRFKWIGSSEILQYVDEILYKDPKYLSFTYINSNGVETVVYDFIINIINILDLEYIPIVDRDGEIHYTDKGKKNQKIQQDLIDPEVGVVPRIDNYHKTVMYLNHKILQHFSKYFVK